MHLKEQYNKTLMVDIGWISTQTRFFQDKTGFLIFTDSYIKVSKFKVPGEGSSLVISIVTVVTLIVMWFLSTNLGWIEPLFLPSPQDVFRQFAEYLMGEANDRPLWEHFLASMLRVTGAFWLAFFTAVPLGIGMGMSRVVRGIFDPPIEFYRPLPPLAYLPLIIIWFGIDEEIGRAHV